LAEALSDPDLEERQTIVSVEHPKFGKLREVNTPARFAGSDRAHRRAPSLGEDTLPILKDYLSYSNERIEALRNAQVI
jgi:crotonobetainyl-CoA:carnitine CoA-transferase CaiB-like acyl-CoA transferase